MIAIITPLARRLCLTLTILSLGAAGASAHEFWLEPATYTPKPGVKVPISIKIGQHFKGDSYPFLHEDFKTFNLIRGRTVEPVKGVDGDDPAVTTAFARPGLHIMVHYSTPETLTFETWDKFDFYLKLEGLNDIAERHRQRGLPETGVIEVYSRCAKLLEGVGDANGEDRFTGMPLELVAEKNPYQLAAGEPLPVRLLRDGRPAPDVQIAAIPKMRPGDRQIVRTDRDGRAALDLKYSGPWLLNAVMMEEPKNGEKAHWTSLWASMTFARP